MTTLTYLYQVPGKTSHFWKLYNFGQFRPRYPFKTSSRFWNLSAKNDPQKYFLAKKTPKKQLTKHGSSSGCALDVHRCHNDSPCDHHGMPTVRLVVLFSSRNTLFVHPPSTHSYLFSFFLLSCPPMLSYLPFLSSSFLLHTATASHKYQKQRSAEGGIAINARSSEETNFSESLAPNKFELMN